MFNELKVTADTCSVGPLHLGRSKEQSVQLPICPDKSLTHRALIFAGMAEGISVIKNPLDSDDCRGTLNALRQLGVGFEPQKNDRDDVVWYVRSPGIKAWRSPSAEIDLGNSGTSARLLTGLFAGVPGLHVTLRGDHSLMKRPMARVIEPLRSMGAQIESTSGGADGATLPLTITGTLLSPIHHKLTSASAQVKSALLLAGSTCKGEMVVSQPSGSRDHTENIFDWLGAVISRSDYCGIETIKIVGPWMPGAFECDIPSDPSSIAFFAALAALHPGLAIMAPRVLLNPSRTGFFRILQRMGVEVSTVMDPDSSGTLGEFTGSCKFYRRVGEPLKPIVLAPDEVQSMIDEVPILAVVAGFADGVSILRGLGELRFKESNRLDMTARLMGLAGLACEVVGDSLQISGRLSARAFSFSSDDHRLVMAAMVLSSRGDKVSDISGLRWIETSFPLFVSLFQNIYSVMARD